MILWVLVQHEGKKLGGVKDDLLKGFKYFLGSQLHDLPTEIDNPKNLFMLLQYFFCEMH